MNSLIIPPSPNWYENTVFACASDNTVIYGSRSDVVVIKPRDLMQPADVKIIPRAHNEKIKSVAISPAWDRKKLATTLAADRTVKLWNMEEYVLQLSHRGHTANSADVVGLTFAGSDRIVSVSVDGAIIVWRFGPNELVHLKDLLGTKPKVTALSACPHSNWMIAFGMHNGLIVVTDLRKSGRVLYKLRRHDEAIVSLTWCPVQYNVLRKQQATPPKVQLQSLGDQTDVDSLNSSVTHSVIKHRNITKKPDLWANLKHADDEDAENSDNSRQLPEYFDVADNVFAVEDSTIETPESPKHLKTRRNLLENRVIDRKDNDYSKKLTQKELKTIHVSSSVDGSEDNYEKRDVKQLTEAQPVELERALENLAIDSKSDGQDNDFLAACAALRKRILVNRSPEENSTQDKPEIIENDSSADSDGSNRVRRQERRQAEAKPKFTNQSTSVTSEEDSGFLEACAALRNQILSSKSPEDLIEHELKTEETEKECSSECFSSAADKTKTSCEDSQSKQMVANIVQNCPEERDRETENVEDQDPSAELESKKVEELSSTKPDKKEFLLASSSKGGNVICIWSVGADGRLQAELHLSGRSHKYKSRSSGNHWITVLWITPTMLLSSSKQGELLSWDLRKLKGKGFDLKPTLVHNDHATTLFCIAAPVEINKEEENENWREVNELRVWTMGQDRYILNTSLGASREVFISYPTIGGPIQCLVQSPLDPNRIAIGIGDGTARVWDLSKPHLQCVMMTRLWQKMSPKVLALAWHPIREAILAYGTSEGRIGIADTLHPLKSPVLMTQYFNKGIYQLQWGPLAGQSELGLYACSEGKVAVYNTDKPIEDPFVVPTPEFEQITQFTWNDDFSILAMGAKSGTIFFYTPDFQLFHTTYHQQKAVQCLLWHPEAFVESPHSGWLACATNDTNFVVYDCSALINKDGSGDKDVSVVANLSGHSGSVKSLSWNPHDGNKLVSAGEDSVTHVWDVPSQSVIASFLGHGTDGVLAVLWSPLDTDFVISGGRDNTVRVWKVSECQPVQTDVVESVKTKKKSSKSENVEDSNVEEQKPGTSKPKKVLDSLSRLDGGALSTLIDDCRRLSLSEETQTNGDVYKIDVLDVFKGRDEVLKLLDIEEEKHLKAGKRLQAHHISLWKGDISETIKRAIANGTVTPFLISLAPMVSPKLWQEACSAYSKTLAESQKGDPLEMAAYFLALHKVDEAIEALLSGGLFREALALAKSRLGEQDPWVSNILERWATAAMFDGNFEIAAQCNIALGRMEEAVKLLFRRSDEVSLKLALDMAERVENEDLRKAVLVRYNAFKNQKQEVDGQEVAVVSETACGGGDCNPEKEN